MKEGWWDGTERKPAGAGVRRVGREKRSSALLRGACSGAGVRLDKGLPHGRTLVRGCGLGSILYPLLGLDWHPFLLQDPAMQVRVKVFRNNGVGLGGFGGGKVEYLNHMNASFIHSLLLAVVRIDSVYAVYR